MIKVISTKEAWGKLQLENSFLIDVRSAAEWQFVGEPLFNSDKYLKISLLEYPNMSMNLDFLALFNKHFTGSKKSDIFCLCRSGVRSHKAAEILLNDGYESVYNIADGFEGEIDNNQHRNKLSGWKFNGLPWKQS